MGAGRWETVLRGRIRGRGKSSIGGDSSIDELGKRQPSRQSLGAYARQRSYVRAADRAELAASAPKLASGKTPAEWELAQWRRAPSDQAKPELGHWGPSRRWAPESAPAETRLRGPDPDLLVKVFGARQPDVRPRHNPVRPLNARLRRQLGSGRAILKSSLLAREAHPLRLLPEVNTRKVEHI